MSDSTMRQTLERVLPVIPIMRHQLPSRDGSLSGSRVRTHAPPDSNPRITLIRFPEPERPMIRFTFALNAAILFRRMRIQRC